VNSSLTALSWEILKRGRLAICGIFALLLGASFLGAVMRDHASAGKVEAIFFLLLVMSLVLVFGVFHYAEFNPRTNWHGFPYRLFALPVPTSILAGWPMLLAVMSVMLVYLAWQHLVFASLGRPLPLWPGLVSAVGIVCYQALIWSLAGFRVTRVVALALAGIIFMNLGMLPMMASTLRWPEKSTAIFGNIVLPALTLGAYFAAWLCLTQQRHGHARGRGLLKAWLRRLLDNLPQRHTDFASPAAAQFWFEWRRSGLLLPICTGFVLIAVFAPVSWLTRSDADATLRTLGWALILPALLALGIGKGFSKPDFWSAELSLPQFVTVRPLPSGELIITKMKVAALAAAASWLQVLLFLACWLPLWANRAQLQELWAAAVILWGPARLAVILILACFAGVILTWRFMISGLWIGLSGDRKRYVAAAILQAFAVVFAIWLAIYSVQHWKWSSMERTVSFAETFLGCAVFAKVWLAGFSWRPISLARAWSYLFAWTVASGALLALGLLTCPDIFWLKPLVILFTLLPVPLARLGLARLALTKNRHRN
jgi:hypothetical protein